LVYILRAKFGNDPTFDVKLISDFLQLEFVKKVCYCHHLQCNPHSKVFTIPFLFRTLGSRTVWRSVAHAPLSPNSVRGGPVFV